MHRLTTDCPSVLWRREVHLHTDTGRCLVDGTDCAASIGHWMFYLPQTGEKFFHAKSGRTECIHPTRPSDEALSRIWANETYSSSEWRTALTAPIERRLAELWVASERLWKAGLGPQATGLTFAENFRRDGEQLGPTVGLISENVDALPAKEDCRDEDMLAAGVRPDRIRSSIRQQLRGYVIDLTSVVGVQPIDGEGDIRQALRWIESSRAGQTC